VRAEAWWGEEDSHLASAGLPLPWSQCGSYPRLLCLAWFCHGPLDIDCTHSALFAPAAPVSRSQKQSRPQRPQRTCMSLTHSLPQLSASRHQELTLCQPPGYKLLVPQLQRQPCHLALMPPPIVAD
jgi:hypothetical protein